MTCLSRWIIMNRIEERFLKRIAMFVIMWRQMEIEIETNATSKFFHKSTVNQLKKRLAVSKRVTRNSTTNEGIIQIKIKYKLTDTMRSSEVVYYITSICKI